MKNNILLVEDDINFGSVMKSYLELNDFLVEWVDDGKNAVATFEKVKFDLCVLDVMLPHVDGFTIATEIKKINSTWQMEFIGHDQRLGNFYCSWV